jgi:hypothetical protein
LPSLDEVEESVKKIVFKKHKWLNIDNSLKDRVITI